MSTASPARATCMEFRSASEYTATDFTPILSRVRMIRQAMAPRLAIRTFEYTSVPDQNLNRSGIVGVAGIIQLRAVADDADHVHFGLHLDIFQRIGNAVFKRELAVGRHRDVHEEVDVGGDIALLEAPFRIRNGEQETVPAGMHMPFFDRVANLIALRRAGAAERVMPATRIGHNREHG